MFCEIDSRGLYAKTLRMRNLLGNGNFFSLALTKTLAYYVVHKL